MLQVFHWKTQIPKNTSHFVGVPKNNISFYPSLHCWSAPIQRQSNLSQLGQSTSTINTMFHLLVNVRLLAIAIQSNEVKHFIHSCYKKQCYNWDMINAQGNVGEVWIFLFSDGDFVICDLSHGWTHATWFCRTSIILCRKTQNFGGKWIQNWDLWFVFFVIWVFRYAPFAMSRSQSNWLCMDTLVY